MVLQAYTHTRKTHYPPHVNYTAYSWGWMSIYGAKTETSGYKWQSKCNADVWTTFCIMSMALQLHVKWQSNPTRPQCPAIQVTTYHLTQYRSFLGRSFHQITWLVRKPHLTLWSPVSSHWLGLHFKLEICTRLLRCSRSRPVPAAVIPIPVPVPQWSIPLPFHSRSFHSRSRSRPGPVEASRSEKRNWKFYSNGP